MSANKTRTGLFETPRAKISSPVTPRMTARSGSSKLPSDQMKTTSSTPLNNSRHSVERPRSKNHPVNSRSSVDRSPTSRADGPGKGTDLLHAELSLAQENLNKAKDQLSFAENEKSGLLRELKEAKDRAHEAAEKLADAIAAQKEAEDCIETEKFRVVELEQTSIEASLQQEMIWKKELDGVHAQHAADKAALASTTKEVERLKHEVAMTVEARKAANLHADEALSIAEGSAEKVSMLSGEVNRVKALMRSELERKEREAAERVQKMNDEMEILRSELGNVKESEKKVIEMEGLIENLRMEISETKKRKVEVGKLAEKWKEKSEDLERRVEEASRSERLAAESLETASDKFKESRASLELAESEMVELESKVESLEMERSRHGAVLVESENGSRRASSEMEEMEKTIQALKSEIRSLEEKKSMAVDDERRTASELQTMVDQKTKLVGELQLSNEKRKKTKKSMDDLASALEQVTGEARESQEMLLRKQAEFSDAKRKIIELQHTLKTTEEKYESSLKEAQTEIIYLKASIEASVTVSDESKSERSGKEVEYVSYLKQSQEQMASLKSEMDKVVGKLKGAELEAARAKGDGAELSEKLNIARFEASSANEAAEEARTERLEAKEKLSEKEDALRHVSDENENLRSREEAALKKIEQLSALLENARTDKIKSREFSAVVVETDGKEERVKSKHEEELEAEAEVAEVAEEEEALGNDGRSSCKSGDENEHPENKRGSGLISRFGKLLMKKKKKNDKE